MLTHMMDKTSGMVEINKAGAWPIVAQTFWLPFPERFD